MLGTWFGAGLLPVMPGTWLIRRPALRLGAP
jgi:hypothetical protein